MLSGKSVPRRVYSGGNPCVIAEPLHITSRAKSQKRFEVNYKHGRRTGMVAGVRDRPCPESGDVQQGRPPGEREVGGFPVRPGSYVSSPAARHCPRRRSGSRPKPCPPARAHASRIAAICAAVEIAS